MKPHAIPVRRPWKEGIPAAEVELKEIWELSYSAGGLSSLQWKALHTVALHGVIQIQPDRKDGLGQTVFCPELYHNSKARVNSRQLEALEERDLIVFHYCWPRHRWSVSEAGVTALQGKGLL